MTRSKKRLVDLQALGITPPEPLKPSPMISEANASQDIEKLFTVTPVRMNGSTLHKLVMVSLCNGREVARVDLSDADSTRIALANLHQASYDVFVEQKDPKTVRDAKNV